MWISHKTVSPFLSRMDFHRLWISIASRLEPAVSGFHTRERALSHHAHDLDSSLRSVALRPIYQRRRQGFHCENSVDRLDTHRWQQGHANNSRRIASCIRRIGADSPGSATVPGVVDQSPRGLHSSASASSRVLTWTAPLRLVRQQVRPL